MKKKNALLLVLPVITLILEALPYGAVLNFADPEGETTRKTFSYFSLTPYGYANFAPFITAITTVLVFALVIVYLVTKKEAVFKAVKALLAVGVALSLCPLIMSFEYFSLVAALVSVTLTAELAFVIYLSKQK